MKKFILAIVAMYVLGIGPCDVLAFLRPAPKPRPRIIDIIRPREEPQPDAPVTVPPPPTTKASPEIQWHGDRQYIVRGRERCYWSASKGAWMKPKRGACAGGICGYEAIKPGQ